jgi:hypothetical protein
VVLAVLGCCVAGTQCLRCASTAGWLLASKLVAYNLMRVEINKSMLD